MLSPRSTHSWKYSSNICAALFSQISLIVLKRKFSATRMFRFNDTSFLATSFFHFFQAHAYVFSCVDGDQLLKYYKVICSKLSKGNGRKILIKKLDDQTERLLSNFSYSRNESSHFPITDKFVNIFPIPFHIKIHHQVR